MAENSGDGAGSGDARARRSDLRRQRRSGQSDSESAEPSLGRPSYHSILELSAGLTLISRSFDFNDPVEPLVPRNYRSGLVPALLVDAGLYPFAFLANNPLGNLGVVGSYFRVPVLRSNVDGNQTDTTLHQWEVGLRYRWNILGRASSPILRAGADFGRMAFVIHYDLNVYNNIGLKIPLPNVAYLYLKLAFLDLKVPFYTGRRFSFGGLLDFNYLYVFSAGDIQRTDPSGYGPGSAGGLDLGGGLYAAYGGFSVRATGFYRRMFFSFDQVCAIDLTLGCNTAGGALDVYAGITLLAGYAF